MLGTPTRDRKAERRATTCAEIVAAAWQLCAAEGLGSLSLRDLAAQVGLKAPSLYSYFDSKNAVYDAMFAQGYQEFLDQRPQPLPDAPLEGIRAMLRYFVTFCVADPVRYQLMFQRTIPGFEPSPESYKVSLAAMRITEECFGAHDFAHPGALDLFTAIASGIAAQQNSNEPGGDRWARLVDDAAVMFIHHTGAGDQRAKRQGRQPT